MASKSEILAKIDLYDCLVTAAQSEYTFKRDQAIADGQATVVAGLKTHDQVNDELQDVARLVAQQMIDKGNARLPLLREICTDIDLFVGKLPEVFAEMRQQAAVILLAASVENNIAKSVN